jgi:hypothetical protein
MSSRFRGISSNSLIGAVGAAFLLAACAEGPISTESGSKLTPGGTASAGRGIVAGDPVFGGPWAIGQVPPNALREILTVCKAYTAGAVNPPAATFQLTAVMTSATAANYPNEDTDFQFSVPAGMCVPIWFNGGQKGPDPDQVTVTELDVPGYDLVGSQVTTYNTLNGGTETPLPGTSSGTIVASIGGPNSPGAIVVFTNTPEPPPPTGGEGCTPGYWKQDQHLDSWQGYSPGDALNAVFGVTFSSTAKNNPSGPLTLLQALQLNGNSGGEQLFRHGTAALLNAANSGVDYKYTTAEVIAMVQAAWASGDATQIAAATAALAGQNESGCRLN